MGPPLDHQHERGPRTLSVEGAWHEGGWVGHTQAGCSVDRNFDVTAWSHQADLFVLAFPGAQQTMKTWLTVS